MHKMWQKLRPWTFDTVHSLFFVTTVRDPTVKKMVLASMQLQARYMEHENHALMDERWDD